MAQDFPAFSKLYSTAHLSDTIWIVSEECEADARLDDGTVERAQREVVLPCYSLLLDQFSTYYAARVRKAVRI